LVHVRSKHSYLIFQIIDFNAGTLNMHLIDFGSGLNSKSTSFGIRRQRQRNVTIGPQKLWHFSGVEASKAGCWYRSPQAGDFFSYYRACIQSLKRNDADKSVLYPFVLHDCGTIVDERLFEELCLEPAEAL
jgi:hypothetical protein